MRGPSWPSWPPPSEREERTGRTAWLIAESADNDPRVVSAHAVGGLGLDAQWNDDFHHAVHVALTGERTGYYSDYAGPSDVARAMDQGFVYQGQYSRFRRRRHGAASAGLAPSRLVHFVQNHDQIGNRAEGERLSVLVKPEQLRLAAALVALAPGIPLIFMGEEYAETAPFAYFVDHADPALIDAVRRGRAAEHGRTELDALDPADADTFERSILDDRLRREAGHRELWLLYQALLALRAAEPALRRSERNWSTAYAQGAVVTLTRSDAQTTIVVLFNLGGSDVSGWLSEQDTGVIWEEPLAGAHHGEARVELAPWQFRLFRAAGGAP